MHQAYSMTLFNLGLHGYTATRPGALGYTLQAYTGLWGYSATRSRPGVLGYGATRGYTATWQYSTRHCSIIVYKPVYNYGVLYNYAETCV